MSEHLGEPSFLLVLERAALCKYQERAEQNPVLHEFADETARDITPVFKQVMGDDYELHSLDLYKGYYRLLMDFCDNEPKEDEAIDMIHGSTVMGAFCFLADRVYGRNWEEVAREFSLLAVSLEVVANTYETPVMGTHDARFGFLFAMALENGTVTGLQRPKEN